MNKELKKYVNEKFEIRISDLSKKRKEIIDKMEKKKKQEITNKKEEKRLVMIGLVNRLVELSKDENIDNDYRIDYLKNITSKNIFSIRLTQEQEDKIYKHKDVIEIEKQIEDIKKTNELVILRLSLEKNFDNINEILKEYGMEL